MLSKRRVNDINYLMIKSENYCSITPSLTGPVKVNCDGARSCPVTGCCGPWVPFGVTLLGITSGFAGSTGARTRPRTIAMETIL